MSSLGANAVAAWFDVDHFKEINDTNGHDVGDTVLCELVENLSKVLRTSDLLARSGGDEFLVMAPETSQAEAQQLAERLLRAAHLELKEQHGQVTISVGVAIQLPGDTVDSLIKRSDQALYLAKQQGRNCTMVFDESRV